MQWSFGIGRVFGSEIRIHLTFFLLLAWIGIAAFQQGGQQAAIESLIFIIAIFACVVLHELGHAVAAKRYGIATPKITLLPIGGVAELERMPENPREEIVVALAGPAVNVVIAAILIFILGASVSGDAMTALEDPRNNFLARLASVNVILVLFNLIPAFPMDGGRVLRALLAMRYPRTRATAIAARIGQFAAFAFGFLGLIGGNPLLIFVAIFVYLAAAGESQAVSLQDVARGLATRDVMISHFETLTPQSSLRDAADALLSTTQHEFPVVDGSGRLRGILTRAGMVAAIQARGMDSPVIEAMTTDIPLQPARAPLSAGIEAMQKAGAPAFGVVDADGALIGYVTPENIGELMMVRAAAGVG
ncbi:MAG TPA: site-2 protease family protein [Rhizobiaceae bacterium]|nr:site-2 protease family protein [Rhizobiaceae bacterium]